MISVRLSEDEYSGLLNLCGMTGARSVSDLARHGLQLLISGLSDDSLSHSHADGLQGQIELLNQRIEELNQRILSIGDHETRSRLDGQPALECAVRKPGQ